MKKIMAIVLAVLCLGCQITVPPIPTPIPTPTPIPMPVPVPTPEPIPTPTPDPVVADTNEAAHGLDFATAIACGDYSVGQPITATLSSMTPGATVRLNYSVPSSWTYNGACVGLVFVCWQQNGQWKYGRTEWLPAGTGYSFAPSSFYNGNNDPRYGCHLSPGDPAGFFVGSTKGERSNVIFGVMP